MILEDFNIDDPSECQELLALNDRFIRRYTELVERYGLFPACGEIIYEHVKKEFPPRYIKYLDEINCINGLNCLPPPSATGYLLNPENRNGLSAEFDPVAPDEKDKHSDEKCSGEELLEKGNICGALDVCSRRAFEATMRQVLDWSNIYSVGLKSTAREEGLQVQLLLGHLLGIITSFASITCYDMHCQLAKTVAEQGIVDISRLELLLEKLQRKNPLLTTIFRSRHEGLEEIRKFILQFIEGCKKHIENLGEL
jgi:hypothetical protein